MIHSLVRCVLIIDTPSRHLSPLFTTVNILHTTAGKVLMLRTVLYATLREIQHGLDGSPSTQLQHGDEWYGEKEQWGGAVRATDWKQRGQISDVTSSETAGRETGRVGRRRRRRRTVVVRHHSQLCTSPSPGS